MFLRWVQLKEFTDAHILLTLPVGYKVDDLRWLSVWCRKFGVSYLICDFRYHL